jgi:hypothetical protein
VRIACSIYVLTGASLAGRSPRRPWTFACSSSGRSTPSCELHAPLRVSI